MKTCKGCGAWIEGKLKRTWCSEKCRRKHILATYRELNPSSELSTGTVGAISELIVCADLLRRGLDVFRALSPSASCDVAALWNGKLLRVEVTTGHKQTATGKLIVTKKDESRFDLLAIVVGCEVIYQPDLFTATGREGE